MPSEGEGGRGSHVLCCTALRHAMLLCAALYLALLCSAMLGYALLCSVAVCSAMLCYAVLYLDSLNSFGMLYAALYLALLCSAMLGYAFRGKGGQREAEEGRGRTGRGRQMGEGGKGRTGRGRGRGRREGGFWLCGVISCGATCRLPGVPRACQDSARIAARIVPG